MDKQYGERDEGMEESPKAKLHQDSLGATFNYNKSVNAR